MPTLQFKGRSVVWNHHLSVPFRELKPVPEKSLTDKISLHDNLIIHGDNLHALKALLPTYSGKIKCIYIDPPYNTGNEGWKYNDNVNSPLMKEWLGKEVGIDDEERHEKWLCMMTPRLKLLRELMKDDGLLFVSINDIEVHRLKSVIDEIFGDDCHLATFIWNSRQNVDSRTLNGASQDHEYILCYSKESTCRIRGAQVDTSKYKNPDNDPRGQWMSSSIDGLAVKEARPNLHYIITNPATGTEYSPSPDNGWRFEPSTVAKLIEEERMIWPKNKNSKPRFKRYLNERKNEYTGFSTILKVGFTEAGTKELRIIMDQETIKFPKPVSLIKELITQGSDNDSIILDSFAGSGTTAHAVLDLNKEDGGNRKFILVECEDYANDITAERVRRVINGVPGAKKTELRDGLGGGFSYFELGEPIEIQKLLEGENLPSFDELARYVFFTATGEEIDIDKINQESGYIGSAREYDIYMIYKPEIEFLRKSALTLDYAENLPLHKGRTRVVFAPARFLSAEFMAMHRVEYCQLPYELYRGLK
ncbi:site-specific DNA-methyltransferase [bacterium]|nr:site-specific DNA-methyltransferase [bacterium]